MEFFKGALTRVLSINQFPSEHDKEFNKQRLGNNLKDLIPYLLSIHD